jgi:predicted nuclease of restriction endonuclease-like (RecB) superfamily
MDIILQDKQLFSDICQIIDKARIQVAVKANAEITLMYWHIGHRINTDVLGNQRAEYGKQIVSTLSTQLQERFQTSQFSLRSLRRMMQFAEEFPNLEIVTPLVTHLSWTHFLIVLPIKDSIAREFYLTMAANANWSKRELEKQIDGMLFERTTIAGKDNEQIKKELAALRNNDVMSPDLVFKNPYFLDFTGLKNYYSERDLEDMLITGLQQFIMELGNGFTFVDRQKRIIIDGEDFYLDLLFYHRKLHRLIAIELKKGKFKASYKGQMELYLRWLDKYERQPDEEAPLGLLLCSEGSEEQIELLQLDKAGIQVAQYYTELPPKHLLIEQLQKQLSIAKQRLDNQIESKN